MHAQFLLGPAGSGKTWRCLEELRTELLQDPAGSPLLFLTPKQATFQIERQLLADPRVAGFTRLRVLSMDRLAADIVAESDAPLRVVSQEGRGMILRALLGRHQRDLEIFRTSARLPGLARQLGLTLRELRRHRLGPEALRRKAEAPEMESGLAGKLRDCARMLEAYQEWIAARSLHDEDAVLDQAIELVRRWNGSAPRTGEQRDSGHRIHHLWLDGFAEMTPQQIDFLTALVPHCATATLAFCLPGQFAANPVGVRPWSIVGKTFTTLMGRLQSRPDIRISLVELSLDSPRTRFHECPLLGRLEHLWATGGCPHSDAADDSPILTPIRLVACPHPEAEAVLAAREILTHVRRGGRFREATILLRTLETHHAVLARILERYQIPFFMDRRESVAHHPLAELTRHVMRSLSGGWQHEDWFGALKTGLLPAGAEEVDWLENEALEHGWSGIQWLRPFAGSGPNAIRDRLESVRTRVVAPMLRLHQDLFGNELPHKPVPGRRLADSLLRFWEEIDAPGQLERWADDRPADGAAARRSAGVHRSVWEQMLAWMENLDLAFAEDALPLTEWIPLIDAGLAELTIGVIPPGLDQVLVGAVDRSRNPDVKLVLILGLNDGLFPARPAPTGLFSEADRRGLQAAGFQLGSDVRTQLLQERYYAYIAFTRSSGRIVASWSERNQEDQPLLPSPWISLLRRWLPEIEPERYGGSPTAGAALHPCELASTYLARRRGRGVEEPDPFSPVLEASAGWLRRLAPLAEYHHVDHLDPALAAELYGPVLRTSVSALERFGACPFQFFVNTGLKAEERRHFELDPREQGSFQHEVLARFHHALTRENRHWRELSPEEGRERIRASATEVEAEFREGLLRASAGHRFIARSLTASLEDFVEITLRWMTSYRLDPVEVEMGFGLPEAPIPAWTLDLGDGRQLEIRGKIDRVDLGRDSEGGVVVVVDYKSSRRTLDQRLLHAGIQLQLPAYLLSLHAIPEARKRLRVSQLRPGGAFYVNLRGQMENGPNRGEVLSGAEEQQRRTHCHRGRFSLAVLSLLDANAPGELSGQFHVRLKKSGEPVAGSQDGMTAESFREMLSRVEESLRAFGRRILAGDTRVDPYRIGQETACDRCEFAAICRIDRWTHPFRTLRSGGSEAEENE